MRSLSAAAAAGSPAPLAGSPISVTTVILRPASFVAIAGVLTDAAGAPPPSQGGAAAAADAKSTDKKSALRDKALADAGVQAMLEVFPAEIRDVEEM